MIIKKITTRLQNRANDILERYNRSLNDKFTFPQPTLSDFLAIFEKDWIKVTRLENIRYGKKRTPNYKDLTLNNIIYF